MLQPEFEKCDVEALREQNRYRRQQLTLLAGGTIGAILAPGCSRPSMTDDFATAARLRG